MLARSCEGQAEASHGAAVTLPACPELALVTRLRFLFSLEVEAEQKHHLFLSMLARQSQRGRYAVCQCFLSVFSSLLYQYRSLHTSPSMDRYTCSDQVFKSWPLIQLEKLVQVRGHGSISVGSGIVFGSRDTVTLVIGKLGRLTESNINSCMPYEYQDHSNNNLLHYDYTQEKCIQDQVYVHY